MEFHVTSGNPEKQRTACLVVGLYEAKRLSESAAAIDQATDGAISAALKRADIEGRAGQTLLLPAPAGIPAERLLLVGAGKEREFGDSAFRRVVRDVQRALGETGAHEATLCLTDLAVRGRDLHWKVRQVVQGLLEASYRFDQLKSRRAPERRALRKVHLSVPSRRDLADGEAAVRDARAIATAVNYARDLGNLPPNRCTPAYLAEQAQGIGTEHPGVQVRVLERAEMESAGMGALLAVAAGSQTPPKLIAVEYRGAGDDAPVCLVGKGITFDSGGLSIKPAANMDEMKYDMCGAAAVLACVRACAELALPLNVVAVVPATENLPSGTATRPGDIVTSLSGQTIEILNTDAEGRLILCDALTWAQQEFRPRTIIDVATLTGACVVALGKQAHGLFSNHAPLAHALLDAGRYTCDRAWELPLWDEYEELLKSNFADMANVGGRDAGAISAACFLHKFARREHWAHLDIAGTAWLTGDKKGATGRPVPLLMQYLLGLCPARAAAGKA